MNYGYVKKVQSDFAGALDAVTAALKEQGFGVLTKIDVRDTLKTKLDVEFRPYTILGACNPEIANMALRLEPEIGLLLPCNVVVQETADGVSVSIADPKAMFSLVDNTRLQGIVEDADRRLAKVIDALA